MNYNYSLSRRRLLLCTSMNGAMQHTVTTSYDTHGRRATKKVTTNGSITLHQHYIYRGYLQLACCDLTRSGHPCLWLLTWDPTQPIATRPLAIRKDGTWYAYGWDLTKNICEVFGQHGYLRTAYSYSPYGEVTADGDVTQPVQCSSEYNDTELALVYYNYRHYNPLDGRWIGRDLIGENTENNLYEFVNNSSILRFDVLGMYSSETWTGMATENGYYTPNKKDEFIITSLKTTPNPNMSNPTLIAQIQAYWNAFWNNVVEEYYGERGGNKVTSIDDLKSNLKTKDKKCIKNLVFVAHGSKTDTKLDSVKIHMSNGEELKESRTSEQISDTFAATSYCKGCTIKLIVCNLGSSQFLKSRLESKTGCKITLYKNGVNPLFV